MKNSHKVIFFFFYLVICLSDIAGATSLLCLPNQTSGHVKASVPQGKEYDLTWSRQCAFGLAHRPFHIFIVNSLEICSHVWGYIWKNVCMLFFYCCCGMNCANKRRELIGPLLSLYAGMLTFQFSTKGSQAFPPKWPKTQGWSH